MANCLRHVVLRIRIPAAVACLILGLLPAPWAEAAPLIGRTITRIEVPRDTKSRKLKTMFVGDRQQESVAEITSIRLKRLPQGDVESMRLTWVVTLSNTRSITQVANLTISLLDERGKRLGSARGRLRIATSTTDKEYELKMKFKAVAWEASRKLELKADWIG